MSYRNTWFGASGGLQATLSNDVDSTTTSDVYTFFGWVRVWASETFFPSNVFTLANGVPNNVLAVTIGPLAGTTPYFNVIGYRTTTNAACAFRAEQHIVQGQWAFIAATFDTSYPSAAWAQGFIGTETIPMHRAAENALSSDTAGAGTRRTNGSAMSFGDAIDTQYHDLANVGIVNLTLTVQHLELLRRGVDLRQIVAAASINFYAKVERDFAQAEVGGAFTYNPATAYPSVQSNPRVVLGYSPFRFGRRSPIVTQTVTADALASPAALYAPSVAPGSVTITADAIGSPGALYAPTVAPGSVTVVATSIGSPASLHEAAVTVGAASVVADSIASPAQIHQAAVVSVQDVTAAHLASPGTIYQATVAPGSVTVTATTLASPSALYQATVVRSTDSTKGTLAIADALAATLAATDAAVGTATATDAGAATLVGADAGVGTLTPGDAAVGTLTASDA